MRRDETDSALNTCLDGDDECDILLKECYVGRLLAIWIKMDFYLRFIFASCVQVKLQHGYVKLTGKKSTYHYLV